ncbi:MAG: hypothetical protein OCU12_00830 [Methanophagales archaeon]|nr:hypothetical protein [Methanophagales archaeon]
MEVWGWGFGGLGLGVWRFGGLEEWKRGRGVEERKRSRREEEEWKRGRGVEEG